VAQPLKPGVLNNIEYQFAPYPDEPVHRVVDDFLLIQEFRIKVTDE